MVVVSTKMGELARAVTAVAVMLFFAPAGYAQLLQPSGLLAAGGQASTELFPGHIRDIISGNNTRGPFALSWRMIPEGRESVQVDGRTQIRGIDYQIDFNKGLITFSYTLKATSLARVDYQLDSKVSVRNEAGLLLPVDLDLYSSGSSSLQFTALYKDQAGRRDGVGDSVFGLRGKTSLSDKTTFTSSLYYSNPSAGGDSELSDRSAMSFGVSSSLGQGLTLTGGYSRSGRTFAGAKEYGLTAGLASQNMAITYKPDKSRLSFSSGYRRTNTDTVGNPASIDITQNLGYSISNRTQFKYSRQELATELSGNRTATLTNTYLLDHQLAPKTAIRFTWTDTDLYSSQLLDRKTVQHLNINSNLLTGITASANIKMSSSETTGDAASVDVSVKAAPKQGLEVEAIVSQADSDKYGKDNKGELRVSALPDKNLKVSAGISERQVSETGIRSHDARIEARPVTYLSVSGGYKYSDDGVQGLITRDVRATATPFGFLKAEGQYKDRDSGQTRLETHQVSLSLSPFQSLGVVAAMSRNPEDNRGFVQQYESGSLGLRANLGVLSLTGDYALKDEYLLGREWMQTKLGLGIALDQATRLIGGYEYSEVRGVSGYSSRRLSIGYSRNLGSDFNVSVSGSQIDDRDALATGLRRRYEADVKLGVKW